MSDGEVKTLGSADIQKILELLPHRYPFLLIDKIVDIDGDNSGIGIKNVTMNEPHFTGHFPGQPVMPGVLIIEGMAQAAGAICLMAAEIQGNLVYLMTIDNARFRKPVVPGDVLELHVQKTKKRGNIWKFHCDAIVDGTKVAEADIGAMLVAEESAK
ncbi:MAG: 3-hydroxyacyl-ACP dehydratase FabZ [Rhizobiaceae bacterium]|nr:3-hydroxyacyl-ACP dehydratase FabZ [Rhizobiaceae bacterium]